MSANTKNSPIFASNTNENIIVSNEQSYDDLIGYCALRKQFARIIPSYYTEIQNKPINNKRKNISNLEEYKKLKQIEDLRVLMRKVGNKQINNNDKKHIINTINNNYCSREKQDTTQNVRSERKDSNGFKASSDEGLSLAPTTSGLSSAQDDDMGGEGIPKPDGANYYSNSGSWCFVYEDLPSKENLLNNPERKPAALASN